MRVHESPRHRLRTAVSAPGPTTSGRLSRRRAMTILGSFAGLPLLATDGQCPEWPPLHEWNGTSLGCPSRLLIYHRSRAAAEEMVTRCVAEIERLERIFGLYRDDSEITRLNRDGRL